MSRQFALKSAHAAIEREGLLAAEVNCAGPMVAGTLIRSGKRRLRLGERSILTAMGFNSALASSQQQVRR